MNDRPLLRIGEAAQRSGVPAKTIRFYEQRGVIAKPARGANHYRGYSETDVETLRFVQRARHLGFSLKEIADLLALYRDPKRASRDVKRLALEHVAELDQRIATLTAMRDTINELARRCHGDDRPHCPILDELKGTRPRRR